MPTIHPTAQVSRECTLAEGVEIGPYCILTGRVTLGPGVRLMNHVVISGEAGPVTIGARTQVWPFAVLGMAGQDLKFKPGMTGPGVTIGEDCTLREYVTVHASTKAERPTIIGNRVFMMVNSHAGHDAWVHDGVTLVNNVALGGHVEIHERATIGGGTVVHQFDRVGKLAMMSGGSTLSTDLPPYCLGAGRNGLIGLNLIGMRRAGMPREEITLVRQAFREVFRRSLTKGEMLDRLKEMAGQSPAIADIHQFVLTAKRTISPYVSAVRDQMPSEVGIDA